MFGISTILSSLLLLSTLASASPAPAPAGVVADVVDIAERAVTCKKKSYQAFRLYAAPAGSSGEDWVLLKLIDLYTPRPTNDTIQALSICTADDCGHLPSYWTLDDQVLHAVFAPEREGWSTAGLRVQVDSQVRFVTSDNASVVRQQAKQYCATRDPNQSSGLPGRLAIAGSQDDFYYCTNIPTVGTPARADIYYKPVFPSTGGDLERYCTKVYLVMQSIGIIAEPIPA